MTVIGIVGAGVMGAGIAQSVAGAGFEVILVDISEEALGRALVSIRTGLRFKALFAPQAATANPDDVMERIRHATDLGLLAGAHFVIENIVEDWLIKQPLYASLDRICAPDCILAANTSSIPIEKFAAATARPDRVIGMHFMNPVPLKPVVEVICGKMTSQATLDSARQLLMKIGKQAIVVNDSPGFVSNRVLMLTINEAVRLVQEGVAAPEDIDKIFTSCFDHKMGPLATADLIGLDTIYNSLVVLHYELKEEKFLPCSLLTDMVKSGQLGNKSGEGFYRHNLSGAEFMGSAGKLGAKSASAGAVS